MIILSDVFFSLGGHVSNRQCGCEGNSKVVVLNICKPMLDSYVCWGEGVLMEANMMYVNNESNCKSILDLDV